MKATATATAGGGSNDDNGAAPDAKGGGAEVIGVDGDNENVVWMPGLHQWRLLLMEVA